MALAKRQDTLTGLGVPPALADKLAHLPVATDNVNDTTPTEAECVAAFGTAAAVGAGFVGIINDAGGNANVYVIVSTGTKYGFLLTTICS